MKIPEKYRRWKKDDVRRISNKVTEELDEFREEHPGGERGERETLTVLLPSLCGLVEEEDEQEVTDEGWW